MAIAYGVALIVSHFTPAEVEAVMQAASLLLGPLMTGYAFSTVYGVLRGEKTNSTISCLTLTSHWIFGVICLTLVSALIAVVLPGYSIVASSLLIVVSIGVCAILGSRESTSPIELTPRLALLSSVLIIGIVAPFMYLRRLAPFPLFLGSDQFVSLGTLAGIESGTINVTLFDDAYLILTGSSSMIAGGAPLLVFWTGPLVQYLVMELGVYILSVRILKSKILALAAAMIPLWFINDGLLNDLIQLLRRNILMAAVPLLLILVLFANPIHDSRRSRLAFLVAGVIPVFYFYDLSPSAAVSSMPRVLQLVLQPGFVLTSPAYLFASTQAGFQGLYVLALSIVMLLLVLRTTPPEGRKAVMVWAGVSFVGMAIEYRMGFLFAMILWALLLINSRGGSRVYAIAGSVGLVFPLIELSGVYSDLSSPGLSQAWGLISQLGSSAFSSPAELVSVFQQSYGSFYYYLAFFTIGVLVLLAWKTSKELRPLGVAMAFSLALFFSPFPSYYSMRFLFLVTPLIVMLAFAAILTVFQVIGLFINDPQPDQGGGKTSPGRLKRVILGPKARNLQVLKSVVLALVILVAASNLTGPYDTYTRIFSVYAQTGYVSSFSPQDIQMANWMRANLSDNTIVVSDPQTITILTALSSMPYTVEGRTYVSPTVTSPIVTADPELFRQVMGEFWLPGLDQLWDLYNRSSTSMGIQPPASDVLFVVNDRTTAWVNGWTYDGWGSSSYVLSSSFTQFEGLGLLDQNTLLVSTICITSSYWAYLLEVPAHQTSVGPTLTVSTGGGNEPVGTLEEQYGPSNHFYSLNLTGSNVYVVSDVPSQWSYLGANGNTTWPLQVIKTNQTTYFVSVAKFTPQIQLRWFSY